MSDSHDRDFRAPMTPVGKLLSLAASLGLLAASGWIAWNFADPLRYAAVAPLLLLLWGIGGMVRSYHIRGTRVIVRRWLYVHSIDFSELRKIRVDPISASPCLPVLGLTWFFTNRGLLWSPRLGLFRGYVTDAELGVVIKLQDGSVYAFSPDSPGRFLNALRSATR